MDHLPTQNLPLKNRESLVWSGKELTLGIEKILLCGGRAYYDIWKATMQRNGVTVLVSFLSHTWHKLGDNLAAGCTKSISLHDIQHPRVPAQGVTHVKGLPVFLSFDLLLA